MHSGSGFTHQRGKFRDAFGVDFVPGERSVERDRTFLNDEVRIPVVDVVECDSGEAVDKDQPGKEVADVTVQALVDPPDAHGL